MKKVSWSHHRGGMKRKLIYEHRHAIVADVTRHGFEATRVKYGMKVETLSRAIKEANLPDRPKPEQSELNALRIEALHSVIRETNRRIDDLNTPIEVAADKVRDAFIAAVGVLRSPAGDKKNPLDIRRLLGKVGKR